MLIWCRHVATGTQWSETTRLQENWVKLQLMGRTEAQTDEVRNACVGQAGWQAGRRADRQTDGRQQQQQARDAARTAFTPKTTVLNSSRRESPARAVSTPKTTVSHAKEKRNHAQKKDTRQKKHNPRSQTLVSGEVWRNGNRKCCDEADVLGASVTRSGLPGEKQIQRVENIQTTIIPAGHDPMAQQS